MRFALDGIHLRNAGVHIDRQLYKTLTYVCANRILMCARTNATHVWHADERQPEKLHRSAAKRHESQLARQHAAAEANRFVPLT